MSTLTTAVDDKAAAAVAGLSVTAPRTIIADPEETAASQGVEPNGVLVWTNRSTTYPAFKIEFQGSAIVGNPNFPASPGDTLIGRGSVVAHMAGPGVFHYKIRHIPVSGNDLVSKTFAVRSCVGC